MNKAINEQKPICPLITIASPRLEECLGERCAWWMGEGDGCAMALLSLLGQAVYVRYKNGDLKYYISIKEG